MPGKSLKLKCCCNPKSNSAALGWNGRGLENLESGNKEEAIKYFEKAIDIDPDWQEPRENLKKCLSD